MKVSEIDGADRDSVVRSVCEAISRDFNSAMQRPMSGLGLIQVGIHHNGEVRRDVFGSASVVVPDGVRPYELVYAFVASKFGDEVSDEAAP